MIDDNNLNLVLGYIDQSCDITISIQLPAPKSGHSFFKCKIYYYYKTNWVLVIFTSSFRMRCTCVEMAA